MKIKKLAALFMGVVLTGTIFAGCNKGTGETKLSDYSDYVTLGAYTGLDVDVSVSAEVTDEQVQAEIDAILEIYTTQEEIKEGTVKDKDKINLDYTGYLDGEKFEGGSTEGKGTDYTIGGNYIKDLNDQLIGLEVGKEYDLECTFPEDYGKEELNGKTVIFKVTVNCIYGKDIVPEWNDELVKTYTKEEYKTVADFEKAMKDTLAVQNLEDQEKAYEYALWAAVIENCKRNGYPEDVLTTLTDDYYSYYKDYYTYVASYYGITYEEYLKQFGATDEKVKEDCLESAKSELEYMMVASEIAKKEKITISEDEYNKEISSIVEEYSYESEDKFLEQYADHPENYLYESFIFDKVTEYLKEQNKMVYVEATEAPATTPASTEK
jgi:trigger factor